ncbi:MAG: hypothetical protein HW416_2596 [Chloroflexi bacterium]|nr:hypothetical protein [Chloroflexota bacterium]
MPRQSSDDSKGSGDSDEQSEKEPNGHFPRRVAEQLAEAPLAERPLGEQLVQHAIEDARLDAYRLAKAGGVVHDHGGEYC